MKAVLDEKQKEENGLAGDNKVLGALEDAIVRGLKNMSLGAQDQQAIQKIETGAK